MTTNLYINLPNVHGWNFILTNRCHTVSVLRLGDSCLLPISLVFLSFCNICQLLIHGWWAELDQWTSTVLGRHYFVPVPGLLLMAAEGLQTFLLPPCWRFSLTGNWQEGYRRNEGHCSQSWDLCFESHGRLLDNQYTDPQIVTFYVRLFSGLTKGQHIIWAMTIPRHMNDLCRLIIW